MSRGFACTVSDISTRMFKKNIFKMSCMCDPATTLTSDGGFKNGLENTSDGVSNLNTLVTTVVKVHISAQIVAMKAMLHNHYYCCYYYY